MFCPHCGKKVADSSHFCGKCGARLRESQSAQAPAEQVLYTIGPFGIELWDGHFSIWKWQRRNSVIIELTNLRLCAVPNRSFGFLTVPASKVTPAPSVPFSIPYASITAIEVFPHPAGPGPHGRPRHQVQGRAAGRGEVDRLLQEQHRPSLQHSDERPPLPEVSRSMSTFSVHFFVNKLGRVLFLTERPDTAGHLKKKT